MANGKIRFGKQSGGELALVFPDGVANTEVTFPESGILATKQDVDDSSEPMFVANDSRVKTALNASGEAPIYACRAWVNFNGTGTVAIRASGNVSSITDNGIGKYIVNFTAAMPDANYAVLVTSVNVYGDGRSLITGTATSCPVLTANSAFQLADSSDINVAIF